MFRGKLAFDAVARGLYATDASVFELTPLGVAVPHDEPDLQALVKYAQENRIPLIPRGAGTGLAGESLGTGIVVDLSVHLRRVVSIDDDTITAEAGVTHAELNTALAPHGRRFAPDPASSATCTVGGMIATNASGGNAFRHGYTRDHVHALQVVWDNGETATMRNSELGTRNAEPKTNSELRTPHSAFRTSEIHAQTAALLVENRDLIQLTRPQTRFNRCGYVLHDVLSTNGVDLPRLLTGSEGTLAFTVAATLRTIPLAGGTTHAILGFPTMDAAARAGLSLRSAEGLATCDLLDPRQLAMVRSDSETMLGPIPLDVGAALYVVWEAESERRAVQFGTDAISGLKVSHRFVTLAEPTCEPSQVARIQRFRQSAVSGLAALGPGPRPTAFVEDVAVPSEELPRFLAEVRKILLKFDRPGSMLTHVLTGQVHTRPFLDLENPADRELMWPIAEAVHGLALSLGGTVSSQHGTGIARTPWVEKQFGPIMPVFRELKRIFDPAGILNPGKIIGPDPSRPAWPLRNPVSSSEPDRDASPKRSPLLLWPKSSPEATVSACNGCGDCRTRTAPARMCPVFRVENAEAASPRAKANLLRTVLTATPDDPPLPEDVRAVADLCVNCKMCRDECRAGVDIPRLMLEAKAADHAERGLDRTDWMLARVEALATFSGNFAFTTNRLLGNRLARWAFELLFGLSRHRTLPKFTHRTFLRRAKRAGWTRRLATPHSPLATRRVAYFADIFANAHDPHVGEATVAVLMRHGYEVHVPPRQKGCGMAPLAHGDVESAREIAQHNVRQLADLVRDGFTILCSEPTAALALTQDYLELLTDSDAALIANNTVELTSFLWGLHLRGELDTPLRPIPVTLGHHVPCHVKALRGPIAGPKLLGLIPGMQVRTIDKSCSGMAGTWGLRAERYADSLEAGRPMLDEMRRPGVLFGSTECGTCRMQMQEGSGKRTLHPIQYLAMAYGLLPELESRLVKPLGKLVTD